MIDYQTYCQIRQLYIEKKLSFRQIARELKLDLKTVRKWARRERFQKAPPPKRESKLDAFGLDSARARWPSRSERHVERRRRWKSRHSGRKR